MSTSGSEPLYTSPLVPLMVIHSPSLMTVPDFVLNCFPPYHREEEEVL